MDIGVLYAIVEPLGDNLLPVSVSEEVYRPGRDNPNKGGSETLE